MARRSRTERGSLSPAIVILIAMVFLLAGLVLDGGRQLGARSRAAGYAQEAARAGAAAIDLNSDEAKIDVAKAGDAIGEFCREVMANDTAVTGCEPTVLNDEQVRVEVQLSSKTAFLAVVGYTDLTAKGAGEAHAEQGILKADDSPTVPPLTVIPTNEDPDVTVNPTAQPPTLDIPCPPNWTIGAPTPTWTLDPFPMPASCTPSITPTPTPTPTESTDPTDPTDPTEPP
ncbi:pilus assembly protein TadG-related protein [Kribbella deserti]|uniref:Pilus assembly protein TadG-related protein n=1 Tax=Kribbella deserti TaxID=1926257 RepID=A0ABV6QL01_9ACTN